MKYLNRTLIVLDIVFFWWYIAYNHEIIKFANWLNKNPYILLTALVLVLIARVTSAYYVSRNKKIRWQHDEDMIALRPELDKIPNEMLHKEFIKQNNYKSPGKATFTLLLIEMPTLMLVYMIAKHLNGELFGLPLSKPNLAFAVIVGLTYLAVPKYTDWTMIHPQRWYMPLVAFLASSTTNLAVAVYMFMGAVTMLIMGHGTFTGRVNKTADEFITETPDALEPKNKPRLDLTGDGARLFLRTFQQTIRYGFLVEVLQLIIISAFTTNVWYQVVFTVFLIVVDFTLPDKHYGWFR
jgi:hypothetical protein